jgi:hypothetical protein
MRSESLAEAFEAHGIPTVRVGRDMTVTDSELVVQTGFGPSVALRDAIERRIPYIVMEAPFWRHIDVFKTSSWGYNGLAGGAWRPTPPDEPRDHPPLQPMKTEGKTLIIGQKPTDHSLRGADHVEWILRKQQEYPEAVFRPHPLMVAHDALPPIAQELSETYRCITYTSTVGAEALIAGAVSEPEHPGSCAYGVEDREAWIHGLSWGQAKHTEMLQVVPYILSGYEEALERAKSGLVESPREKVDGASICQRYYRAGL